MPAAWHPVRMMLMDTCPFGVPGPILVTLLLAVCCLWCLREGTLVMTMRDRRWAPVRLLLMGVASMLLGLSTLAWIANECL